MGKQVGRRLRQARQREGLSQAALADRISVAQQTVANWEAGGAINDGRLEALERILGPLKARRRTEAQASAEPLPTGLGDETSSFGGWVREQRTAASLSVPELAKASGLSAASIYNIENGAIRNPQSSTRTKLEAALKATPPVQVIRETEDDQRIEGLGNLVDFDPHQKSEWPTCQGVYVLYDGCQRPVYVGKAERISSRLKEHEDRFWFKAPIVLYGSYIEVKQKEIRHQLEQVLIKFLKANALINKQSVEAFSAKED